MVPISVDAVVLETDLIFAPGHSVREWVLSDGRGSDAAWAKGLRWSIMDLVLAWATLMSERDDIPKDVLDEQTQRTLADIVANILTTALRELPTPCECA